MKQSNPHGRAAKRMSFYAINQVTMKTLQISINALSLTIACFALYLAIGAVIKVKKAPVEIAPTGWQCADLIRDPKHSENKGTICTSGGRVNL